MQENTIDFEKRKAEIADKVEAQRKAEFEALDLVGLSHMLSTITKNCFAIYQMIDYSPERKIDDPCIFPGVDATEENPCGTENPLDRINKDSTVNLLWLFKEVGNIAVVFSMLQGQINAQKNINATYTQMIRNLGQQLKTAQDAQVTYEQKLDGLKKVLRIIKKRGRPGKDDKIIAILKPSECDLPETDPEIPAPETTPEAVESQPKQEGNGN